MKACYENLATHPLALDGERIPYLHTGNDIDNYDFAELREPFKWVLHKGRSHRNWTMVRVIKLNANILLFFKEKYAVGK